jgi:uncharacterized phage protein (TIGR02218 family)
MKTLPSELAAHLEGEATTLCNAWRVTRRDGVVLGFTDHDEDLVFDGTLFQAASGYQASEAETGAGLAAPSSDVMGALSSEAISADDIAAGRYDGARVELFSVNWQAPSQHIRMRLFEIGDIVRTDVDFRAELRGLAHKLDQLRGRVYGHRCDADFGDARCGKPLSDFKGTGTVQSVPDMSQIAASGLSAFPDQHFTLGLLTFTSGRLKGQHFDIETHRKTSSSAALTLWLPFSEAPLPDDTFEIVAGCDKSFEACRTRFDNVLNFRGFPHMPGSDFSYSYVDGEIEHDGGPLYE